MKTEYDTQEAAYEAGYIPGRAAYIKTHRGYEIRIVDVSGPAPGGAEYSGYDFALIATADDGRPDIGPYGRSIDMHFAKERNKLGDMGAIAPVFEPREFKESLRIIWREIDRMSAELKSRESS